METTKYKRILMLLDSSPSPHLADCLDMVPERNLDAIMQMIATQEKQGQNTDVIRYNVVQDMASLVSGYIPALFSQPFLDAVPAPTCMRCNAEGELKEVSIPGSDITRICHECYKTLEMYAGTNGVL